MTRLPAPAPHDPIALVQSWLDEAARDAGQRNPTAMALASSDATGRVSARMVLLKKVGAEGYGHFFTHFESRKAKELAVQPWAAGVLHWDQLGRQLRLEGPVTLLTAAESDRYFSTRPWRSQLNAWASRQSAPLPEPTALEERARARAREFGLPDPLDSDAEPKQQRPVPRPHWWGGYRLWFAAIEFWAEGAGRFHERLRYERDLSGEPPQFTSGPWKHLRLQP